MGACRQLRRLMEAREQPSIMSNVMHISPVSKSVLANLRQRLAAASTASSAAANAANANAANTLTRHNSESFLPKQTSWFALSTPSHGASERTAAKATFNL